MLAVATTSPALPSHVTRPADNRLLLWTVLTLLWCLAWDTAGQDLALARWFGDTSGFAYRDHWLFSGVLHRGARRVAWTLQFALILAIGWPVGVLRLLSRRERVDMFITSMVVLLVLTGLKSSSSTSCPWELREFGGVAAYVSHWRWGVPDGGEGKCFPAGHASAAFCFFSGYFALRHKAPRAALIWLVVTLAAGALIGFAQQVRGAHYLSHTFWTAWICWVVAGATMLALERFARGNPFTPPGRS